MPLQPFGLRKIPELSLALLQALSPSGADALSSSNGRFSENRPFAHSAKFSGHKGAGKTGCALHPRSRVQCAHSKSAHEHTGSAEAIRPSLRNGFTAYFALSPVTGFLATVACE